MQCTGEGVLTYGQSQSKLNTLHSLAMPQSAYPLQILSLPLSFFLSLPPSVSLSPSFSLPLSLPPSPHPSFSIHPSLDTYLPLTLHWLLLKSNLTNMPLLAGRGSRRWEAVSSTTCPCSSIPRTSCWPRKFHRFLHTFHRSRSRRLQAIKQILHNKHALQLNPRLIPIEISHTIKTHVSVH